jgi:hypothetical protein
VKDGYYSMKDNWCYSIQGAKRDEVLGSNVWFYRLRVLKKRKLNSVRVRPKNKK